MISDGAPPQTCWGAYSAPLRLEGRTPDPLAGLEGLLLRERREVPTSKGEGRERKGSRRKGKRVKEKGG